MTDPATFSAGIIKAVKDTNIIARRVWRDSDVPDNPTMPYVTVTDPVTDPPHILGDAKTIGRRRQAQVDVWQDAAKEKDEGIAGPLARALDGVPLLATADAQKVLRCRVMDTIRLPDDTDANVLHHVILLQVDYLVPTS